MNKTMTIEISYDIDLYSVSVNGETVLECLGEDELEALTIADIVDAMEN